jgi:hypothetical protein
MSIDVHRPGLLALLSIALPSEHVDEDLITLIAPSRAGAPT